MIKLTKILQEIGDASIKPYPYSRTGGDGEDNDVQYRFKTDQGQVYDVIFELIDAANLPEDWGMTDSHRIFELQFMISNADMPSRRSVGASRYTVLSGGNEPLKIMSTIVSATTDFNDQYEPDYLTFSGTSKGVDRGDMDPKGADQKTRMYLNYIKQSGGKVVKQHTGKYLVDISHLR